MTTTSALQAGISGATAAALAQRASSRAIAHATTPGYRAEAAGTATTPGGGVMSKVAPTGAPAPLVQQHGVLVALSTTDLTREVVTQVTAAAAYRANLAVIRTADQMERAALELVA